LDCSNQALCSRVDVVGKIVQSTGKQCIELILFGCTTEKCVLSFSASDSENEGDRVGDHLAGRRLSQQVIKVFQVEAHQLK